MDGTVIGVRTVIGVLDTVEATGHPLIHEDVRTRFGVELSSVPVIRSGQFITVRDNAAIPELLRELHAALDVNGSQASP